MEQVFFNGRIYTMNGNVVTGLWARDGIILESGDGQELRNKAGKDAKYYDLKERCVIPGLIDSHCHLFHTGMVQNSLDLSGADSVEELILRGRQYIAKNQIPEGQWIIGRGFNQHLFSNPLLPDKQAADAISTKHPVLLDRICGHVGVLNEEAMNQVGLNRETNISGGEIGHNDLGEPNGIVWEAALDYVKSKIPKPDISTYMSVIQSACLYANSLGLTSVHSNDVDPAEIEKFRSAMNELERDKKLTLRIFEEVSTPRKKDLQDFLKKDYHKDSGSEFFKIGNIKIFTDGSLGAHSAYMLEEYSDLPGSRGIAVYADSDLEEMIAEADKNHIQVACHAIGDGAVAQCIEAIEKAQKKNGKKDVRHRIVHCQIADNDLLTRMHQADIASDIQPPFVITDWKVAEKAFGERVKDSYRWRTMLKMGIHLGGGSDSPVESISPIWGIHCAVNRFDEKGVPEGGWHPEELLSVEDAVALYTKDAAYLAFEEEKKGTLEAGKLADFIILSDDIFKIEKSAIKNIKIMGTVTGGNICYQEDKSVFGSEKFKQGIS